MRSRCRIALVLFLLIGSTTVASQSLVASSAQPLQPPTSAAIQTSLSRLQASAEIPWRITWDTETELPRTLAGGRSAQYAGSPAEIALEFARRNGTLFGLPDRKSGKRVDLSEFGQKRVPGGHAITLQQVIGGVPIIDGRITVIVTSDGYVRHIASNVAKLGSLPGMTPRLSIAEAISRAGESVAGTRLYRSEQPARLAAYRGDDTRLVFKVELSVENGGWEPWQVLVDAHTGEIVRRRRMVLEATGLGRVFDPNPIVATGDESLRDHGDSASAVPVTAYRTVALENLDDPVSGWWSLRGQYVKLLNKNIPTNWPPSSNNGEFLFWRDYDGFEDVMAYYTIDRSQTYIQSLGFEDVNNRQQEVDAHGAFNFDNSVYVGVPEGAGHIEFGDGGIDDAEDADIILHEYGHAIQDNSNPGVFFGNGDNGYGNETRAMGEGFSDYWAAASTYDSSLAHGFPTEYVGEWDAKGFAAGPESYLRVVNTNKLYPYDMVDQIHTDGEIWSGLLWELLGDIGREVTDRIVLYSHFLLSTDPDFADGAQALIDADALLYPADTGPGGPIAGIHFNSLCQALSSRGILNCSPICSCLEHGNPKDDGDIDMLDVLAIIDQAYFSAPLTEPDPLCPHLTRSDYDCNGFIDTLDVTNAIEYVLHGGAPACNPCAL